MNALRLSIVAVFLFVSSVHLAYAQDNYEIQVYSSEMEKPGTTMLELHSNFTAQGSTTSRDGLVPTNHAVHETLEVSHTFTDWLETGVYVFSSIQPDGGWQWVGSHIRPRVTVPESWHWPVGVSLGQEVGYQRRQFSENTWTYELQPIIDKKLGRWYLSFNPTFDRALHGSDVRRGFEFSPNAKATYDITKKVAAGLEYYGSLGPATEFLPLRNQHHQFFPCVDLDVSPNWELNFGVGFEPNHASDRMILKFIVGRRFSWHGKN